MNVEFGMRPATSSAVSNAEKYNRMSESHCFRIPHSNFRIPDRLEVFLTLKSRYVCLILIGIFSLSACGYRFAGSGDFPEGVEYIFIEMFENRTSTTGVERIVTNQLIFEFSRQRESSLVGDLEKADAVLKGTINSIRTQTISRVDTEIANEREVVMSVDLRLIKKGGGTVLWAARGLSDREAFDVDSVKIETDRNEELAIGRLSERIAERIFNRLTDDF
jgi:outer membrane lipopolysaccharide assembly protein LptE/RlpB